MKVEDVFTFSVYPVFSNEDVALHGRLYLQDNSFLQKNQIIDKNCNFVISSRNRNCKITFAQKLHLSRVCYQKKRQNLHWQCQSMIYGKASSILDANSLLHKITFSLERFLSKNTNFKKIKILFGNMICFEIKHFKSPFICSCFNLFCRNSK